jgi:hypothetical protein
MALLPYESCDWYISSPACSSTRVRAAEIEGKRAAISISSENFLTRAAS